MNADIKSMKTEMTKEQFDKAVADAQEIQKRNPFGSQAHREAYGSLRKIVKQFTGSDIGEYE